MARRLGELCEKTVFWLLIIQYAFVNLAFGVWTQNIVLIKDLAAPIFSVLILGLWIFGDVARHGRWRLPRHAIVPVTVIALLTWLVSVFHSGFLADAVEEWGNMLTYFVITWAMIRFVDSLERVKVVLGAVLVTNVLMTGYGLSQLLGHDLLVDWGFLPDWGPGVYVSTYGSCNFFSGYLDTTLLLFVGWWFVARKPAALCLLPLLIILNLYEIYATDSRAAYIATAVISILFPLGMLVNCLNLRIPESPWRKVIMVTIAIFVAGWLAVGSITHSDKIMTIPRRIAAQFGSLTHLDKHFTNRARLIFWQMAMDGGMRNPWIGRGIGSFNFQQPETRPPWYHRTGVTHNTDHAHQEYMEWFFETGVLGTTAFLWILVVFLISSLREVWRHRQGALFPLVLGAAIAPWGLWIHVLSSVETRWTGNSVTLWFGVGLALAFANISAKGESEREETPVPVVPNGYLIQYGLQIIPNPVESGIVLVEVVTPVREKFPRPIMLAAAGAMMFCVVVFISWQFRNFWHADYWLRMNMGYTDANQGTPEQALDAARKAEWYNPWEISVYYKLAYTHLVSDQPGDALAAYRTLQDYAPNYAQIHINLAYLKAQMGYRAASAFERERAAMIEHNARNHRDAAMYWMQLGYPMRALPHLRQCFTVERDRVDNAYYWWYDHDNIHLDLAQIFQNQGRHDDAILEVRRALELNPDNVKAAVDLVMLLKKMGRGADLKKVAERIRAHDTTSAQALFVTAFEYVEKKEYGKALTLLEEMSLKMSLPPPGQTQPSQEVQTIGNASLQILQIIFEVTYDRSRCYELAGWIYACQARYAEAEDFLRQALTAAPNDRLINLLGIVRARRGI